MAGAFALVGLGRVLVNLVKIKLALSLRGRVGLFARAAHLPPLRRAFRALRAFCVLRTVLRLVEPLLLRRAIDVVPHGPTAFLSGGPRTRRRPHLAGTGIFAVRHTAKDRWESSD